MKAKFITIDPATKDGDKGVEIRGYIEDGEITITSMEIIIDPPKQDNI